MIQCTAMKLGTVAGPQVAAIILAAGGSLRMGQPKQLLPFGGQPMVRRVTEVVCAAGLDQVAVVIGAHAEAVRQALVDLPVDIILNEKWTEGMSTSVRAGLGILQPGIEAALFVLADQPALTTDLLRALVSRYAASRARIVAPVFQGRQGNPVLFDRILFPQLQRVKGDEGGRALLLRYPEEVELVEVNNRAVLIDIDSRQDYESVKGMEDESGPRG